MNLIIDNPNLCVMCFPLISLNNVTIGVIQCIRSIPFRADDENNARFFSQKFSKIANLIIPDEIFITTIHQISSYSERESQKMKFLTDLIIQLLNCSNVDFWFLDNKLKFFHYDSGKCEFHSAKKHQNETILHSIQKNNYYLSNHGNSSGELSFGNQSFLCVPYKIDQNSYAISIQKKENFNSFGILRIKQLVPLTFSLIENFKHLDDNDTDMVGKKRKCFFDIAELLNGVLNLHQLIKILMKGLYQVFQVECCSLFVIDIHTKKIISKFQGEVEKSISFPLSRGIVGYTALTGEIINIVDVEKDPRSDKEVDLSSRNKTLTLLSAPIYNNRGEIILMIILMLKGMILTF